jgi:cytoplasmic iron level regulating protein YaaA (DUF328/UPF0246 family)
METSAFVILLPPSEGKADGGKNGTSWNPRSGAFGKELGEFRSEIAQSLAKAKGGPAALLGVSGKHLARAQAANKALVGAPTLPAWQRYTGVVWDHLDLASLTPAQRKPLLGRILIPSGMAGLVRADDFLPDYRLKMGARFAPFGLMSTWWRDDLTSSLVRFLRDRLVVDLLPQEHRAAFDWSNLNNVVRVDLVSRTGGTVGGHNAKAAKGLLARHLLMSKGTKIAPMVASFPHDDYIAKVST